MEYFPGKRMSGGRFRPTITLHFIICLSFFCSWMSARSSNEIDMLALLSFKAKITHDPFKIMRLWNGSTHFCQWYGVICDTRHERVTELNLFSLELEGSISPNVGNLSFLHVVQLQNNRFIGQIPSEVGHLRRLRVLCLHNNSFGGEIPLSLSNCSKLWKLRLAYNKLEGKIPLELGSLSKLQHFSASKNNLSGTIPYSIGNLTFLEVLGLAHNNLVGRIPKNLGRLSHLTFLTLGENLLSEVPSSIFNLSSLEILELESNKLGGSLPSNLFHTLPNLQYLSTIYNQFVGCIPVSLSNASNLQRLQLAENMFIGKVPFLGSLNKLWSFVISNNQLGSGIGSLEDLDFLCSLTNATTLNWLEIGNNNFGGMLPRCITNLSSHLTFFKMDNNHIRGSIPQGIDNLVSLLDLNMRNNSLTGTIPPTIGNMKNLVILFLNHNNLSGQIPTSLGKLSKLNKLDLSYNSLEGRIPSSLQNCTSLQILLFDQNNLNGSIPPQVLTIPSLSLLFSVSQNQLTGPLPEEVGKLTNLFEFHVSSNMLSGRIPYSLGKCMSLQYLYMDGNNFQGSIPSSLSSLRGLRVLELSSNNLSGQIPDSLASLDDLTLLNLTFNDLEGAVPDKGVFANASVTLLEGNNKLCGGTPTLHLPVCIASTKSTRRGLGVKIKAYIFIVVAVVSVALSILLLLYIFGLRRKKTQSGKALVVSPFENHGLQFLSYKDLHRATRGFSEENRVGSGGFGCVYKGILGEGEQVVAVKVLNLNQLGARRSFIAECEALRNIRHKNLVKLLTVCSGVDYQGNEFKALVYEFMSNGSLEDWLYSKDNPTNDQDPPRNLGLAKRLAISIDVASLLDYAHHQFGAPLVHCDIKPSNILLDDDLCGHVSDFGLAKFLSDSNIIRNPVHSLTSCGVIGTIGYAPPEYGIGSEVSIQGDVYSYGILLLEIFTGKRPTHEMFKEGLSLHLYAKMALPSRVMDILDPTLQPHPEIHCEDLNPRRSARIMECLVSIIEIGVACSNESPTERMDMGNVITRLCGIRDNLIVRRKGTN